MMPSIGFLEQSPITGLVGTRPPLVEIPPSPASSPSSTKEVDYSGDDFDFGDELLQRHQQVLSLDCWGDGGYFSNRDGIWSGKNRAQKVYVLKSRVKVYALASSILPYSIEAKRVESTGTGSDRSFTVIFMCVLKFLLCFKESKEKKTKNEKRRVRWNMKWET